MLPLSCGFVIPALCWGAVCSPSLLHIPIFTLTVGCYLRTQRFHLQTKLFQSKPQCHCCTVRDLSTAIGLGMLSQKYASSVSFIHNTVSGFLLLLSIPKICKFKPLRRSSRSNSCSLGELTSYFL